MRYNYCWYLITGMFTICIFLFKHILTDLKTLWKSQRPVFLIINSAVRIDLVEESPIIPIVKLLKASESALNFNSCRRYSFVRFPERFNSSLNIYSDLKYLDAEEVSISRPLLGEDMLLWASKKWVRVLGIIIGMIISRTLYLWEDIVGIVPHYGFYFKMFAYFCVVFGVIILLSLFDMGVLSLLLSNFDAWYLLIVSLVHATCYCIIIISSSHNLSLYHGYSYILCIIEGVTAAIINFTVFMIFFLSDALVRASRLLKLSVVFVMILSNIIGIYCYLFYFPFLKLSNGDLVFQQVSRCFWSLCIDAYFLRTEVFQ